MLYGVKLSANKLHSINEVPYISRRRNPVGLPAQTRDIKGAYSIEQMKRIEEKLFGRKLF